MFIILKVLVTGIEQSERHKIHVAINSVVCLKKLARVCYLKKNL